MATNGRDDSRARTGPSRQDDALSRRLEGTRAGRFAREFFANSAHFPIFNALLEVFHEGAGTYFRSPSPYILILSALVQSYLLSRWESLGRGRRLLGNLVAPFLYTVVELALENPAQFFAKPQHFIFWGFSLAIGVIQELRLRLGEARGRVLLIPEDLARTGILIALYWVLEALSRPEYRTLSGFLSDNTHLFVAIVSLFLGVFLGFAQMQAHGYLSVVQQTAKRLRRYSEWLLGPRMLGQAFKDAAALSLKRVERSILFMDIRGFTRWSEQTEPEDAVAMLNRYYGIAEEVLGHHAAVKLNFTADEVMAPFDTASEAAHAALALRPAIGDLLSQIGLTAGIGINTGPVIQGLIGSASVKSYNVIGDVVNTAKRIESATPGGAILVSSQTREAIGETFSFSPARTIEAKGKQAAVTVYELIGTAGGAMGHSEVVPESP